MEAKAKVDPSQPVVFTANRLRDGRTVWLAAGDRWSEVLGEAEIFEGAAIAPARARAEAWMARQEVVGAVDVPVEKPAKPGDDPFPIKIRERIRAYGPTVGPDSTGWLSASYDADR